jgi:5-methylcytosine-specific restriction enzyme subunit McrC
MSRTISIFEHERVAVVDESALGRPKSPGPNSRGPTISPLEFAALARFNDESGQRYFELGHRSVRFRHFVGYLQVGSLTLEILPKPDRGPATAEDAPRWRHNLLEMLSLALRLNLHVTGTAHQQLDRPTLLELLVRQLVTEAERITREGLARGYRSEEANGTTFRGRLMFSEHLRENHSRADRCYVRHTVFDCDVPVNRALRAALALAARAPLSGPLHTRVRIALAHFEGVRDLQPSAEFFERLVLGRSTDRYRPALQLARMLIENLAPAFRAGRAPVFALLFNMNALWEGYIAALFRRCRANGVETQLQTSRTLWHPEGGRRRTLRPDILLTERSSGRTLAVLDTKWKVLGEKGPSDEDLKQMFAYNELFAAPEAWLLYPSTGGPVADQKGFFTGREHRCGTLELRLEHEGQALTRALLAQVRILIERISGSSPLQRPPPTG